MSPARAAKSASSPSTSRIQPYGEKTSEPNAAKAKAVRQAVANLIDRDELASGLQEHLTPMYSFIPDGLTAHPTP